MMEIKNDRKEKLSFLMNYFPNGKLNFTHWWILGSYTSLFGGLLGNGFKLYIFLSSAFMSFP